MPRALLIVGIWVCALGSSAADTTPSIVLPTIRYQSDPLGKELFPRIRQAARFQQISQEVIGSPIELRVYQTLQLTGGGRASGTVSGLLAAGTLGILPQVYNADHAIVYEFVVNSTVVSAFSYRKNLTQARNVWVKDETFGLGKEGLEWARSTVDQFLRDSSGDAALAALLDEYHYYFDGPQAVANGSISTP